MDKRLEQQGKDIADIKQGQAHTDTALDALAAGVEAAEERLSADIRAARTEAKADNLHLQGKLDKVIKSHQKRMDAAGLPDPDKN